MQKKKFIHLFLFTTFLLSHGCKNDKAEKNAFPSSVFSNSLAGETHDKEQVDYKLNQELKINNVVINARFKPVSELLKQYKNDPKITNSELSKLKKDFENFYYFVVGFSYNNESEITSHAAGMDQYNQIANALSYKMNEYVSLKTSDKENIELSTFQNERTYGMSKSNDVLLVFQKPEFAVNDWVELSIRDFGLGIGNPTFKFSIDQINEASQ